MFRSIAVVAFCALAPLASAQTGEADQQRMMMQGMQQMQECMAKLDMAAMERMSKEAEAMNAQVAELCAAGERDAAQDAAMAFGMKMAKEPNMQAMAECAKKAQGSMPPMQASGAPTVEELKNRHVCDQPQ